MSIWIAVATLGGVLCLVALVRLGVALRRGQVTLAHFLAALVVVLSLVAYALVDNVFPERASGPVVLAALLPGCVGIVVLLREHRRARERSR